MEYLIAVMGNPKAQCVHFTVKMATELSEKLKGLAKKMESGHQLN